MPLIDGSRPFRRYVYTLTDEDVLHCLAVARRRNAAHSGRKGAIRADDQNALERHRLAVEAEFAVATILGVPLNEYASPTGNRDGVDLVLPGNVTVDVRFRAKRGMDLAAKTLNGSDMKADLFILCWPGLNFTNTASTKGETMTERAVVEYPSRLNEPPHTYEPVSWTTRLLFLQRSKQTTYGRGPVRELEHVRMAAMQDLFDLIDANRRADAIVAERIQGVAR
jgi:hypothetical protein